VAVEESGTEVHRRAVERGLQSIEGHAKTFITLIEKFAWKYDEAKQEARALDFADLERRALKLLAEARPASLCRRRWRGYSQAVSARAGDEYQDINEIRMRYWRCSSRVHRRATNGTQSFRLLICSASAM